MAPPPAASADAVHWVGSARLRPAATEDALPECVPLVQQEMESILSQGVRYVTLRARQDLGRKVTQDSRSEMGCGHVVLHVARAASEAKQVGEG